MKREIRIYNVLFPIWLLLLFPPVILLSLTGNFLVDSAVILLTLRVLRGRWGGGVWKASILRAWLLGFLADFIGGAVMLAPAFLNEGVSGIPDKSWLDRLTYGVYFNPFDSLPAFLWTALATAVAALCIYGFNRRFVFRRADVSEGERRRLSLVMAVVTAPWLFFLPTAWFY